MTDRKPFPLDKLLDEVSGRAVQPSDALMARILADARSVRPPSLSVAGTGGRTMRYDSGRSGWLGPLFGLLCDWPTVGGLIGCLLIGLTLGVIQPGGMRGLTRLGGDTVRISVGVDENPLNLLGD